MTNDSDNPEAVRGQSALTARPVIPMAGGVMKYIKPAIILVLGFLGIMPPVVHAQGAGIEWKILSQEAEELYRAGKYDRAAVVAQKALQVAEQNAGPNHPDVATSLNNLAGLYKTQGDYARAEPLYKRSLAILEKALGPDHPNVATSLENLAALCRATKRGSEAEALEQRAAKIRAIKR